MMSSSPNAAQSGGFPGGFDDEAAMRAIAEQRRHSMTGMNSAYGGGQFSSGNRGFRSQFVNGQSYANGVPQGQVDQQQSVAPNSMPYQSPAQQQQMMNAGLYQQQADLGAAPAGAYPPQAAADAYAVAQQQQATQGGRAVAPTDPRWAEARKSCEAIYMSLSKLSSMGVVTRESFNALKTMALSLASTIDNLDPDKSSNGLMPRTQGSMDLMQQYQQYQSSGGFGANPWAAGLGMLPFVDPIRAAYQQGVLAAAAVAAAQQQQAAQQAPPPPPEKKRRRASSASQRNLFCHMCNATETPEWRRGPDGEHTLCNACGLYYAKMISKQRKEREGRKHSIEILLNPGGRGAAAANATDGAAGPPALETPSPTPQSDAAPTAASDAQASAPAASAASSEPSSGPAAVAPSSSGEASESDEVAGGSASSLQRDGSPPGARSDGTSSETAE